MLVEIQQTVQAWSSGPINIPLRRFAFATRPGPPSKGEFRVSPYYPNLLSWSISLRFSETDQQEFV